MKKRFLKVIFLFVLFALFSFQHSTSLEPKNQFKPTQTQQVVQSLKALPLYFVENKGQVDKCVKYHIKMPYGSIYFTPEEIAYQFLHKKSEENTEEQRSFLKEKESPQGITAENFMMKFIEANERVQVRGMDEIETRVSFFRGNDPRNWVKGARTYKKVLYKELYPQIDLIVYGSRGRIKHEYRVRVGGEVEKIKARYEGIESLRINERGQLEIVGSKGVLREDVPLSFQIIDNKKVEVKTEYMVDKDNTLRFKVRKYRKDVELIIDPGLEYSTYLGGSDQDYGYGIAVDKGGNAYVTGKTNSSDFPIKAGAFDTSYNGNGDVFIAKFNSKGTKLLYSTYLGGSDSEGGTGIEVDGSGNAIVFGSTESTDFPTTPGAYDSSHNGSNDVFVAKLNSAGTGLLYSTYLGGSGYDGGTGITLDGSGNAYVTGTTYSSDFPTTPGAYDATYNKNGDGFVAKFNSAGTNLIYSTYLGGSIEEACSEVAVDGSGNAYVTGQTRSFNFPTTSGAYDKNLDGTRDAFITKLNSAGTGLLYSTYLGGDGSDYGFGIAVDESGNAYVTGETWSLDFPTTSGAYDTSLSGFIDAFVTKLNSAGTNLIYSSYLGGSLRGDSGHSIAVDESGNAYVTGYTECSNFPTTSSAYDTSFNGGLADAFLTKFNAKGTDLLYSTFLGGDDDEEGHGIALDESGNAFVTGKTNSTDFPTTSGAYGTSHSGSYDVFVTKFKFPCKISGRVTDKKTGNPISRAKVKIVMKSKKQIKKSTRTDKDGYYEIIDVKPGNYKIIVRKKNYRPYKNNKVKIYGHVELDVKLRKI